MPRHPKTLSVDKFTGLNTKHEHETLPLGALTKATNVDLTDLGKLRRREGLTQIATGNYRDPVEFKGSIYGIVNGDFCKLNRDFSVYAVLVQGTSQASYYELDNTLFVVSPERSFRVSGDGKVRQFGLEHTNPSPIATQITGTLRAGSYTIFTTYVDDEGYESGCSNYTTIELSSDNSGIRLSLQSSPTSSSIVARRIYCTETNGQEAYFVEELPIGITGYDITSKRTDILFDRFGLYPAPSGESLFYFQGRFYIVEGKTLWYSEPTEYDLFRLAVNYLTFPEPIREALPTRSGIWVASDKLYWVSGKSPDDFKVNPIEDIKVLPGSASEIAGKDLVIDQTPLGSKWIVTSDRGVYVLFSDGVAIAISNEYIFDNLGDSNSAFVLNNGIQKYIVNAKKKGSNSFRFSDSFEAKVIKAT